jgi:hypothetical protein
LLQGLRRPSYAQIFEMRLFVPIVAVRKVSLSHNE